jgi:hypothetical protein
MTAIPVYVHISPNVLVEGDSKLLHRIADAWAVEYRKHYMWVKSDDSITGWEDGLLWQDVCSHNKNLCNPTIVAAINLATRENSDDDTVGLMFAACEFSPSGCGKNFAGALVYATGTVAWNDEGERSHLPESFAVSDYDPRTTVMSLTVFEGCNSFAGDTPVLMPDGKTRPISQVKPGDTVADASPGVEAGTKNQAHTVTGKHVTFSDRDYVDVTVATEDGPETVVGTAHHLYWDATSRSWTQAGKLRVGHVLQTSDGASALIVALRAYTARMVTYNLSVDTAHTYYVVAGAMPILVHNCGERRYESNPKHGSVARQTSRGGSSAEPADGQGALDNSVQIKATSPRRVGIDPTTGDVVILDRHLVVSCGCALEDGMNEIFHGHVRTDINTDPGMQAARNALRKGIKAGEIRVP